MTSSSLLFNPMISIPQQPLDSSAHYRSSLVESNTRDEKKLGHVLNSDLPNTFSTPMLFRQPIMVPDMGLPFGESTYLQSPLQQESYSIPHSDLYGAHASIKSTPLQTDDFGWDTFFPHKHTDSPFLLPPESFPQPWEQQLIDTSATASTAIPLYPPSLTHSPLSMSSMSSASLSPSPISPPAELPASPPPRHNSSSSSRSKDGEIHKSCSHCGATSTPLWRREPGTLRSLCNACGLYLQQRHRLRPQELIQADAAENEEEEYDPSYAGPECSHCHTRHTSVWRRSKTGAQLCNACGVYQRLRGKDRPLSLRRNRIKPRTKHTSK